MDQDERVQHLKSMPRYSVVLEARCDSLGNNRRKHTSQALSIECGKRPPFAGRVRCEECLCRDLLAHPALNPEQKKKQVENKKKRRAEKRAAGLCIDCGKPVYRAYSRCYEHYIRNRRAGDEYRRGHSTGRVKPWNPPPPPRKQSAEHPWNRTNRLIKRMEQDGES